MYIPILNVPKYRKDILLERPLPSKGNITARVGDKVEPFTRLGMSKVSYEKMVVSDDLKLSRHKKVGSYFYHDEKIGTVKFNKVIAPYNGYIEKEGDMYVFRQEERDYWLLSGVWGEIAGISKDISVLIRTQMIEMSFRVYTENILQGELVVFPNPGEGLVIEYLQNFSKNVGGKVIYVGNFLSIEVLKKAVDMKVGGVIAGGCERSTFNYAKEKGMFIALFTGFGHCETSEPVFNTLQTVANRLVFVQGKEGLLRIPVPADAEVSVDVKKPRRTASSCFRSVKKGMKVMVLQEPNFGLNAKVDRVSGNSIFVKFPEREESFEVKIPNILALE
jgi:hypothetical protein